MSKIFEVIGTTNDLLNVSPDNTMKCANYVYLGPTQFDPDEEIFHIAVTSTAMNAQHPLFDKLLNKQVKITVEVLDEEHEKTDEKE